MGHSNWKTGKKDVNEHAVVLFDPSPYSLSTTKVMQRISLVVFFHLMTRLESDGTVDWRTPDLALELERSPSLIRKGLSELQRFDFIARKDRSRSRWIVNPAVCKPGMFRI